MKPPASRLALPVSLALLAALLCGPALFSRTSRDEATVLGLYSRGYAALLAGYVIALLLLAGTALAAARRAAWLVPVERWFTATAARPGLAGALALAATALTGALALWLPGLFSDYGVQYRSWAAWSLGVGYLAPLAVWGVPALTAAGRALAAPNRQRWAWLALAAVAVGLRLVNLNALPLDVDSVRQPFTLDVALALCRAPSTPTDIRITQVWRGTAADLRVLQAGYYPNPEVFPLYQWLVGRLFCALGPATVLARLLSLAGWALGGVGLYGYTRRWHGAAAARWTVLLYAALPLGVYFSRAALRQSLDLGLSLMGLYAVSEWAARPNGGRRWLLAGALLLGVALASYPPLAMCGVVVVALAYHKHGWRFVQQPILWLALAVVALPLAGWYGLAGGNGTVLTADGRSVTQVAYYLQWLSPSFVRLFPATVVSYLTLPLGLLLLALGLRAMRGGPTPLRWAAAWLLAAMAGLILLDPLAAYAGLAGQQHLYVYLILAPPLALVMAAGLPALAAWLQARQVAAAAGALAVAGAAAILVPGLFFLRPLYATPAHAAEMAAALRAATAPDETFLLLTGDIGIGYLAGRRGVAYDVLRADRALPPATFEALLCAAPSVVAVMDPVEMQAVAPAQFEFLKAHYPVLAVDIPGWIFDTRVPALACGR